MPLEHSLILTINHRFPVPLLKWNREQIPTAKIDHVVRVQGRLRTLGRVPLLEVLY